MKIAYKAYIWTQCAQFAIMILIYLFLSSVTAMTGTYDFTSLPVLLTVFAATILGSMIAPLLAFPVTSLRDIDEVQLPGLGTFEVPRLL